MLIAQHQHSLLHHIINNNNNNNRDTELCIVNILILNPSHIFFLLETYLAHLFLKGVASPPLLLLLNTP